MTTWVATGCFFLALTFGAVAQPRQNIAGNYRGLMTGCLTAAQPTFCRKGLTEIVRLADDVDAKYAAFATDGAVGQNGLHEEYITALDTLSRGIEIFNREMKALSPRAN